MRYTAESVDRVRDAIDIERVVGARVDLSRRGRELWGNCPFHDERTPSFHVRPDIGRYHCFGCAADGDAFTFVRETENVDFRGAVELLADRFGVPLEVEDEDPEAAQRRERRERLLGLLERTATFYARVLWSSAEAAPARAYLEGRGLTRETLSTFGVGWAPSGWDVVTRKALADGVGEQDLLDAGVAQPTKARDRLVDRFRGRITFPLADRRGRVVGFGARALAPDQQPKYLNTSENELFSKGRTLYNAHRARAAAAKEGALVVEGYTDVLALHQAGVEGAVAIMGTSLTEEQLDELARMTTTVRLALDADRAGQEAMLRAARMARGRKLDLRVVPMPEGVDPADLVAREGAASVRARIERSVPFVRFHVERVAARGALGDAEQKDRALGELRPVFAEVPPSALREELLQLVSDRLDLAPELVATVLSGARVTGGRPARAGGPAYGDPGPTPPGPEDTGPPAVARLDPAERTERAFLALCVALPTDGEAALDRLDLERHLTRPLVRRAAAHLKGRLAHPLEGLPEDDPELVGLVGELVVKAGTDPATPMALAVQAERLELLRLDRAIAAARGGGGDVPELARARAAVKRRIDETLAAEMG